MKTTIPIEPHDVCLLPACQNAGQEQKTALGRKPDEIYEFDGNKYYERIDPGALEGADLSDVILLFDHRGKPFARRSNGTLDIAVDSEALRVYADLSRTEAARELYSEIGAGLITAMSWGFTIREHSYDKVLRTFTIRKIKKVLRRFGGYVSGESGNEYQRAFSSRRSDRGGEAVPASR